MTPDEDARLAARYGAYASFETPHDPILVETHGDGPAEEMDRLLDRLVWPETRVLELGCGAGQTLSRVAPRVSDYWAIDLEEPLMEAARARVERLGLTNVTLILGNTTHASTVVRLPDAHFDFVFTRRGPFLTEALMAKLTPEARVLAEMWQDLLGLNELLGRIPFRPSTKYEGGDWAIQHHAGLGLQPVSVRHHYFEQYFRDVDHLEAFLQTAFYVRDGFDPERDRPALELYARLNTTRRGLRLTQHRKICLFRRISDDPRPSP